jgi:hypothetical protein
MNIQKVKGLFLEDELVYLNNIINNIKINNDSLGRACQANKWFII